ncbi:MAG: diguanylate cyclase [Lysobacterales bacterium]
MNNTIRKLSSATALLFAIVLSQAATSQEVLVSRFKPDLAHYPQYFSVAQGPRGAVYLGHNQAVIRYDGTHWRQIDLPTAGAVRALERSADGRIWVGGTNSFGYLESDNTGAERFVDLTEKFAAELGDEQFADIWRLLITDDTVFFGALHHLFAVSRDGSRKALWRHSGRFGEVTQVGGDVFVQWRGEGLKRLEPDGSFTMVEGGEGFADSLILNGLALGRDVALVHTREPALYLWSLASPQAPFQRLQVGDPEQLTQLTDGLAVNAHTIAFGGADGAVRVLDIDQRTFDQASISRSFLSGPALADDGALLLVGDEGVLRLPWPARWTKYADASGLQGAVHHLAVVDSELYAMTGIGVYRAPMVDGVMTTPFRKMNWGQTGETWKLVQTQAGTVLAAAHDLRQVTPEGSRRIGPDGLYPRHLLVSESKPNLLWSGNEHGIAVFSLADGRWQLADNLLRLGMRVTSLVPAGDGGVWVGTDELGLKKAWFGTDGRQKLELRDAVATTLGSPVGVDGYAHVSQVAEGLILSTTKGTYRFDGAEFVVDNLGGLNELKPTDEVVAFLDGNDGVLWAHSYRALYQRRGELWTVIDMSSLDSGVIDAVTVNADGSLLLGGSGEIFHYQPEARDMETPGALGLSSFIRAGSKNQPEQRLPLSGELDLQGRHVGIRASFLLTDLEEAQSTVFRSRLLGLTEQWGPWTSAGEVSFPALQPGTYALQAEARTGSGRVFVLPPRSFNVVPRWFESAGFRGVFILGLFGAVLLSATALQRRQVKQLAMRNNELDSVVRQRTKELRAANRKLRDQAERDALTGVGNRRLFDQRLDECFDEAQMNNTALALLMVDVDHFKRYNDEHGHQAGDWVLSKLASVLAENVRDDTVVARYGGEEFAVIVPACDNLSAARLARRLVRKVESDLGEVTISVGVAGYNPERDQEPDHLVGRADDALYSAKRQGRNRFVLAA